MSPLEELHEVKQGRRVESFALKLGPLVMGAELREGVVPETSRHFSGNNDRAYIATDSSEGNQEVAVVLEGINDGQARLDIDDRLEGSAERHVTWIRNAVERAMRRNDVTVGVLDSTNVPAETLSDVGFKPVEGSDELRFAA